MDRLRLAALFAVAVLVGFALGAPLAVADSYSQAASSAGALRCSGATLTCGSVPDTSIPYRSGATIVGSANLTFNGAGSLTLARTANGENSIDLTNGSAGASATTILRLNADWGRLAGYTYSTNASSTHVAGVNKALLSVVDSSAGPMFFGTTGSYPLHFGTNNTWRGFFAADGGLHLKSSSAAVSAAGDIAFRNNSGVFEVSQNGGAYAAPGGGGAGWVATAQARAVSLAGLTSATMGTWYDDLTQPPVDIDDAWAISNVNTATTAQSTTAGGGVWVLTAPGSSAGSSDIAFGAGAVVPITDTNRWYMRSRFAITSNTNEASEHAIVGLAPAAGVGHIGIGYYGTASTGFYTLMSHDGSWRTKVTSQAIDTSVHIWEVYSDTTNLYAYCDGSLVATQAWAAWSNPTGAAYPRMYTNRDNSSATNLVMQVDQLMFAWDAQSL